MFMGLLPRQHSVVCVCYPGHCWQISWSRGSTLGYDLQVQVTVDLATMAEVIVKPRRLLLTRFLRNKTAVAGLVVIIALVIIALIGPWLSPFAYDAVDRQAYLKPPSWQHPHSLAEICGH